MNVIGGRGGLLNVFLGLFMFLIMFVAYVLYYAFVAALWIVLVTIKVILVLRAHHKAKQAAVQQAASLADPPMPVMSRVGGLRDWMPRGGNTR